MKRTTIVEYADASPAVQAIYDEIMKVIGSTTVPNIFKALGNNENILRATWAKTRYTMVEGEVPLLLKQLILFTIAVNAGNEYCTALHGNLAMDLDKSLSCDDLMRLSRGDAYERLPRSFKVAVDLVSKVAADPKSAAGEEFNFEDLLRSEGFGESEIDELLAQADFGVMMNTITDIFDVAPERPFPPPQG